MTFCETGFTLSHAGVGTPLIANVSPLFGAGMSTLTSAGMCASAGNLAHFLNGEFTHGFLAENKFVVLCLRVQPATS
jgi:hypothetical protein